MKFFESIIKDIARQADKEIKQQERVNAKVQSISGEINYLVNNFNEYLSNIGCDCNYSIPLITQSYELAAEKKKLANYEKLIEKYMSLDGSPSNIDDLDDLYDLIEKMKILNTYNLVDHQDDYYCMSSKDTLRIIKDEFNYSKKDTEVLLSPTALHSVEHEIIDLNNSYTIHQVHIWNDDEDEFSELEFSITFSLDKFILFNQQIDFKQQIDLDTDEFIFVQELEYNASGDHCIFIDHLLFSTGEHDANLFLTFFNLRNVKFSENIAAKQNEILASFTGSLHAKKIANNLLLQLGESKTSLLNINLINSLQFKFAKNHHLDLTNWNQYLSSANYDKADFDKCCELIEAMIEIIQEDFSFSYDVSGFISFYYIKKACLDFFANYWESKYDKYTNYKLRSINHDESDVELNNYLNEIIRCKEIVIDDDIISILAYYIMSKLNDTKNYMPYYFAKIEKLITENSKNINKNDLKNVLRKNV